MFAHVIEFALKHEVLLAARMPVRGGTAAAAPLWWTRAADAAARFFATPARNAAPYV